MAKNCGYSEIDILTVIGSLKESIDLPAAREQIYLASKKASGLPNFGNVIINKSREMGKSIERDPYYRSQKIKNEIIVLIEGPEEFNIPVEGYEAFKEDKQRRDEILKMIDWFVVNKKSWEYTRVWFYCLGKREIKRDISYKERIFILYLLSRFNILNDLDEISKGGESLCKLLSLVLDVPWTSLEGPIKDLGSFIDFAKMDRDKDAPRGGYDKFRMDEIHSILSEIMNISDGKKKSKDAYFKEEFELIDGYFKIQKEAHHNRFKKL